jgi:hypothetical protein
LVGRRLAGRGDRPHRSGWSHQAPSGDPPPKTSPSIDLRCLLVGQGSELVLAAPFGNPSAVLAHEHEQIQHKMTRHLGDCHDAALRFVLAAEKLDLIGQIMLDGARHAGIEKLGLDDAVEVAKKVRHVVGDLDISLGPRMPSDAFHQRA